MSDKTYSITLTWEEARALQQAIAERMDGLLARIEAGDLPQFRDIMRGQVNKLDDADTKIQAVLNEGGK